MFKQFLFAATLAGLFAISFTTASAEEMTLDKAIEAWSFLKGDWNLTKVDGTTDTATITKAPNGVAWVFDNPAMHGMFGFDGAEKKMFAVGFHEGGSHSIGHWMPAGKGVVEGTFKLTRATGEVNKHSGRFEVKNKDEITYALDGTMILTFKRK